MPSKVNFVVKTKRKKCIFLVQIKGHTMSENVIVCRFCDKSVSKELLWDHVARDIDYCPFDCEVCAQTFVNKAELIEHEINNDGHKGNYVCLKAEIKLKFIFT